MTFRFKTLTLSKYGISQNRSAKRSSERLHRGGSVSTEYEIYRSTLSLKLLSIIKWTINTYFNVSNDMPFKRIKLYYNR
jgi:hypothetical protein